MTLVAVFLTAIDVNCFDSDLLFHLN